MCGVSIGQGICTDLPGSYECTCYSPYSGLHCENYTPSRYCADLQLFHGITENGTYSISIDANYVSNLTDADLMWIEVFCDMESAGGGWTLMSHGNSSGGKTFNDYVNGFGDLSTLDVWLGLENLHSMTTTMPTSLRIVIEQCATDMYEEEIEECTYPHFSVSDHKSQYSVFINSTCNSSSEFQRRGDPWISWNPAKIGPKFSTFDKKNEYNCSSKFFNTGWWFNKNGNNFCGNANLNGLRFICGHSVGQDMYLTWDRRPVGDAFMYLRPYEYPLYDNHHNDPTVRMLLLNQQ
uniref:Fibrinogen C-terminal domain-containing protein n=1 Tax=Panagrolaimus sp. ES5 TaxID=591445 RepID=A0AC34G7I6_9BILA